jgi:hypothetical protein
MVERNSESLADAFEPMLVEKRGKVNLLCESEYEAALLATELNKRGWRASVSKAIAGSLTDLRLTDVVRCTGRRRGTRRAVANG